MRSIIKASVATLTATTILAGAAFADGHGMKLKGELNITSDMSNPAPRAVM